MTCNDWNHYHANSDFLNILITTTPGYTSLLRDYQRLCHQGTRQTWSTPTPDTESESSLQMLERLTTVCTNLPCTRCWIWLLRFSQTYCYFSILFLFFYFSCRKEDLGKRRVLFWSYFFTCKMKNSTLLIFKLPLQTIASFLSRCPSPTALEQFFLKKWISESSGLPVCPQQCTVAVSRFSYYNTTWDLRPDRPWTSCFRSSCSLTVSYPKYLGPELLLISGTLQLETISPRL